MSEAGRKELEAAIASLDAGVAATTGGRGQRTDAAGGGLFGEGSAAWKLCRERAVVLMAPRAVMLQYAHPAFAAASHHYGTSASDPGARFSRAVATLLAMIFGDADLARKHARRVGRLHGTLAGTLAHGSAALPAGTPWSAEDPAALAWILLTLTDAVVRGSDLVHGRLSDGEVAAFLADTRCFGRLFAVRPEDVPDSRAALDRAIDRALRGTLAVGPETRAMWSFLGAEGSPSHRERARGKLVQRWAAATLPPGLAAALGAPIGRIERGVLLRGGTAIARGWRRLPPPLRYVSAYREKV